MMFGRLVEGNQVFEIFHHVWSIEGYKVIISKLNPIAFLEFCFCLIKYSIL